MSISTSRCTCRAMRSRPGAVCVLIGCGLVFVAPHARATPVWHVATRACRWWLELNDAVDHVVGHSDCSEDDRAHWAELGAVFAKRNAIATGARPDKGTRGAPVGALAGEDGPE